MYPAAVHTALEAYNTQLKQEITAYQQQLLQQSHANRELSSSLQITNSRLQNVTSKYEEVRLQTSKLESLNNSLLLSTKNPLMPIQANLDKQMINELEAKLSVLSSQYAQLN